MSFVIRQLTFDLRHRELRATEKGVYVAREYCQDEYPLQELTDRIIGAAIEVHRQLGPGFLEKIYENSLIIELENSGHEVRKQVAVNVEYRGRLVGQHRMDLLVDNEVVVELKLVESLVAVHIAQLRSTLKAADRRVGLLINFNQKRLTDGLKRVIV